MSQMPSVATSSGRWRLVAGAVLFAVAGLVASASQEGREAAAAPVSSALFDAQSMLDDLRALSSDEMQGRAIGTPGNARARAYLSNRFRATGLQPLGGSFEHPFGARAGANVVGLVPGRATSTPRYIVVSGHFDHVGVRDGQIYNGANDNASGAAALPAVAAYFLKNRPLTSLLVVGFDGEEVGLTGARAFVRAPPVPRETLVVNVNADMIGRDQDRTLYVSGTMRFPVLLPFVTRAIAAAGVTTVAGHDGGATGDDWTRDSDQWAFIEAGIPGLYVGVDDQRYHHRPDDDFESMMPEFYVRSVETIIQLIREIDAGAAEIAAARRR